LIENFIIGVFCASLFGIGFTYFVYPLVLLLLNKLFPFKPERRNVCPYVSIIISAYNEEKDIYNKIKNTLELNYPSNSLEILIGSDGSNDRTASIVEAFNDRRICFFNYSENRGKTAVQNDLVIHAKGKILIFTDAASFLAVDAIKNMVRNFADDRVGCVAGKMRFINIDINLTTQSQGLYWRYEAKLRELESRIGSLIGVDGPLYAVRRDCYVSLENSAISDFLTPMLVLEKGKKVVLESEAIVDEDPTLKAKQEFATRRRIILRGLIGIANYARLLNPFKHPVLAFQIISHKVLRWFVGPLLMLNAFACVSLSTHWLFKIILIMYAIFVFISALGWLAAHFGKNYKILCIPYYFVLVNLAATVGIVDFFRKKRATSWKPVRN